MTDEELNTINTILNHIEQGKSFTTSTNKHASFNEIILDNASIELIAKERPDALKKIASKTDYDTRDAIINNPNIDISSRIETMTEQLKQHDQTSIIQNYLACEDISLYSQSRDREPLELKTINSYLTIIEASATEAKPEVLTAFADMITNRMTKNHHEAKHARTDFQDLEKKNNLTKALSFLSEFNDMASELCDLQLQAGLKDKSELAQKSFIQKMMSDRLQGKNTKLEYKPAKGLKALFMSKKRKQQQQATAQLVEKINKYMDTEFAQHADTLNSFFSSYGISPESPHDKIHIASLNEIKKIDNNGRMSGGFESKYPGLYGQFCSGNDIWSNTQKEAVSNRLTSYEQEVAATSSRVVSLNNMVEKLNEKQASPEEKNLTTSKEKATPDKPSPARPIPARPVKEM